MHGLSSNGIGGNPSPKSDSWVCDHVADQDLRRELHNYAKKLSLTEAEDLVQEAICRALEAERVEAPIAPWSKVVIKRLLIEGCRRRLRADRAMRRLVLPNASEDPYERIEDEAIAHRMSERLYDLPAEQRDVVEALVKGVSVRAYANRRGVSVRSAEGHLRRARSALRNWAAQ